MNTLKEVSSFDNSKNESISTATIYCPTIEFVSSNDVKNISKNVFYACANCNGPLIPLSICICCKRAVTRHCVKCGKTDETKSHDACKILISFGNKIANEFTKEVKQ
ncbi:hypothetical protein NKOR_08140 [Candidatus Nitrosopumilus koreensis AR1]|uniref:Uncharacterized protein n=1 Tax=Candidatus Nitrosopumilus koreensis AR1 TaxID=1229908 RepID=K0B7L6_9ARCH|nr:MULTISPECIES: hypothetical protein [Nitrosopumilus]AFS81489.1 hypothetical protein NKOR_08140 [Candidatus Nitrosopumilus koreensis AR1]